MWYSKQLRLVRRARRAAKTQQRELLALELAGLTAVTLHAGPQHLTIGIERAAGAQVVDTLNEALRERRRALQAEARQLHQDWQESVMLRARSSPTGQDHPSVAGNTPQ